MGTWMIAQQIMSIIGCPSLMDQCPVLYIIANITLTWNEIMRQLTITNVWIIESFVKTHFFPNKDEI